jgi:hypothetical protein
LCETEGLSYCTAALVGGVEGLMTSTRAVMQALQIRLALEDQSGRLSWGGLGADEARVTKTFLLP